MKVTFTLALLLSCLTGFLLAGDAERTEKIVESCMSENGVSPQDLTDLKSGKVKPEDAKNNMKCATQCVLVKFGFMNDKGTLLNDKIMEFFKDASIRANVETALDACGNIVGANACDTAFQMMSCFEKHATDMTSL